MQRVYLFLIFSFVVPLIAHSESIAPRLVFNGKEVSAYIDAAGDTVHKIDLSALEYGKWSLIFQSEDGGLILMQGIRYEEGTALLEILVLDVQESAKVVRHGFRCIKTS